MDFQAYDEDNGFESIDIRQYIALFWQWAWLIALATLLAGLAAYFNQPTDDTGLFCFHYVIYQ